MYKQSPSRNHRSKGIKVKHVLQICLLVAVCYWLIYQVKHSHEKRKEFDAKDEKIMDKVLSDGDVLKFGRKDLPRSAEIATGGDKQGEGKEGKEPEEEENRLDDEGVKYKEDEPEKDDGQTGEKEVETGGVDDEVDENETEKSDSDHVNEEDLVDEDKDKDENEGAAEENMVENEEKEDPGKEEQYEGEEYEVAATKEDKSEGEEYEVAATKEDKPETEDSEDADKKDQSERKAASDEQDRDGDAMDTHEAREELYKADDASSEVAHTVQTIIPETGNVTMGHANKMFGNRDTLIKEVQLTEKIGDEISNVTIPGRKTYEANLTKLEDGSPDNTTSAHSHQLATGSNSRSVDKNPSKNSTVRDTKGDIDQSEVGNALEKNNTSELAAVGNEQTESSTDLIKTGSVYQNATEFLSSNNSTLAVIQKTNDNNVAEAVKDSFIGNDIQVEKSENSGTAGSDETSTSENYEDYSSTVQHDPIDVSDTRITEEEKEARADLDMLPEIKTEVQNSEEAMDE